MEQQSVRDLVTIDDGVMGPSGDKANYIKDEARDNLDMAVSEFCEEVLHTDWIDTVSESYVRQVLRECRPESVAMFDNGEITYA
jgi:hypothetical protein